MHCPTCHATNRDRARFCAACGATLPRVCAHCGAALTTTSRSCPKCGSLAHPESALPRTADGALPPTTTLEGRYSIKRLLGQGGFARVYLARDLDASARLCAVKELTDNSLENQRQFEREASLLRRLSHPRLVHVTDHFQTGAGEMFLVMDFIQGQDLNDLLDHTTGYLAEARIVRWALQVCDVLEYLHTWIDPYTGQPSPVIHRDIKPGNLKLQPDDGVIVIDLGIAKVKQPGHMTTAAARAGSAPYSPVEQYGQGTDERSDIYALGATLYHLTTGHAPPEAPDIVSHPLILPSQLNPGLSTGLEQAIIGCMQVKAADRFQSIAQLRTALTAQVYPAARSHQAIHPLLTDALHRRKWVDIDYTDLHKRSSRRSVLPEAVTPTYLIASGSLHGQPLRFRVDRISSASIEEAKPSPPIPSGTGVFIRPITDDAARRDFPKWVLDPTTYLATGGWERVPLLIPSPAPFPPSPQLDHLADLYRTAETRFASGNWKEAITLYNQILARRPNYRDVPDHLRKAQAKQRQAARAHDLYAQASTALHCHDWLTAVDTLEELQRLSPGYLDVEVRLAQAQQSLTEAQRPERAQALRRTAVQHMRMGRWDAAIASIQQLLLLEPLDAEAQRRLTLATQRRDRYRGSEALYQQAVSAIQAGRRTEALTLLHSLTRDHPGYRDSEQLLARLLQKSAPPAAHKVALPRTRSLARALDWFARHPQGAFAVAVAGCMFLTLLTALIAARVDSPPPGNPSPTRIPPLWAPTAPAHITAPVTPILPAVAQLGPSPSPSPIPTPTPTPTTTPLPVAGSPGADLIIAFSSGPGAQPQYSDPDALLGQPDAVYEPTYQGILQLGRGGSVLVAFTDNAVIDRDGPDLQIYGEPANDDFLVVDVSAEGEVWHAYPRLPESTGPLDLATLGLSQAVYLRLTDSQPGTSAGAEVDAVVALHSGPAIHPLPPLLPTPKPTRSPTATPTPRRNPTPTPTRKPTASP